jgi:predicted dehydrogenase
MVLGGGYIFFPGLPGTQARPPRPLGNFIDDSRNSDLLQSFCGGHMRQRIGMIGLVHDHVWGLLKEWESLADVEIVAIAEPNQGLLSKIALRRSSPRYYDSWEELLQKEPLDLIQLTNENNAAWPVVKAAAARKIPIMLEKPLASTLADGLRIYKAAEAARIPLFVNWFTFWQPAIQTALRMAKSGDIGRLHYVRFRIAHAGPREIGCAPEFYEWLYDEEKNGGGAYIDFCGYGAYMATWLLGAPDRVHAIAGRWVKDDIAVDDNGLLCLQYDRAVGLCEGSWTEAGATRFEGPTIHGDKGSIAVADGKVLLYRRGGSQPEVVPVSPPPPGERSAPEYFSRLVREGERPTGIYGPAIALMVQRILEAGREAVQSGCGTALPAAE